MAAIGTQSRDHHGTVALRLQLFLLSPHLGIVDRIDFSDINSRHRFPLSFYTNMSKAVIEKDLAKMPSGND